MLAGSVLFCPVLVIADLDADGIRNIVQSYFRKWSFRRRLIEWLHEFSLGDHFEQYPKIQVPVLFPYGIGHGECQLLKPMFHSDMVMLIEGVCGFVDGCN